jgi:hypothetical protein
MSRPSIPAPTDEPVTTIIGVGGSMYECPDIAALDGHIVSLRRCVELAGPEATILVRRCWADIDLLLDHRPWLEVRGAYDAA